MTSRYGWRGSRAAQAKEILAAEAADRRVVETPRGAHAERPDVETDPLTFEGDR